MSIAFKLKARREYRKIRSVRCPAFLKEKIVFNARGFNHLFYQGSTKSRTRTRQESIVRVRLLPKAVKLLKLMPIPQEESKYVFKDKQYKFWAFEGVVDGKRIKTIVRQVGQGHKHFWSVIPAWRKTRFGRLNAKSSLSKQ